MPERIVSVAIMLEDKAFISPVEQYWNWRHSDLIARMAGYGFPTPIAGEQGFQTSTRRFVDRVEALKVATAAGQIVKKTGNDTMLFSEDMNS